MCAATHEEDGARNVLSLKLAGLEIGSPGVESAGTASGEVARGAERRVLRRVGVSLGVERVLVPGWLDAEVERDLGTKCLCHQQRRWAIRGRSNYVTHYRQCI